MTKLLYKPVSMLVSVLGGILAGADLQESLEDRRGAKTRRRRPPTPGAAGGRCCWPPPCRARSSRVVKAAVDRGAAEGTRKLTGVWPGDQGRQAGEGA